MDFLGAESALNLFIIGDIENNGFEADFQQVWGDFGATGEDGRLAAVLLRYYGSFIPYAPGDFDVGGFASILVEHRTRMTAFSGIDRVMSRFDGYDNVRPEGAKRRSLFFVELKSLGPAASEESGEPGTVPGVGGIERARPDDVPALLELWRRVEEFHMKDDSERTNRRELEQGAGRAFFVRESHTGQVVATVKTTAENSRSAMIVAVATRADFRRRGLATKLLLHLCRELQREGKRPCLLYDNPAAGSIYRRLGFTDVGTWVMYVRE